MTAVVSDKEVKLPLCLTKNHAMKTCWRVEVYIHAFFDLDTRWIEWSVSRSGRFASRERTPDTHWLGDLGGPRASLDNGVEE